MLFQSSKLYFVLVAIISVLLGVQCARAIAVDQMGLYEGTQTGDSIW